MTMNRKPRPAKPYTPQPAEQTDDVKEALDIVEAIESTIETVTEASRIPPDAEEFFESIGDKAKSIGETINRINRVSDKQLTALRNMLTGVRRWIH